MPRHLVLDTIGNKGLYIAELEELEDYYKALRCHCFDIVQLEVGGKIFDVYIDDNGALVDNPIPSALGSDFRPLLVGNLIFALNNHGETIGLSESDIKLIRNNVMTIYNINELDHISYRKVVYPCELV